MKSEEKECPSEGVGGCVMPCQEKDEGVAQKLLQIKMLVFCVCVLVCVCGGGLGGGGGVSIFFLIFFFFGLRRRTAIRLHKE
jgi:hypothetical protein